MPKEEGNDKNINSQVCGFFSAAAIEEAVQQHANYKKDEDHKQHASKGGGTSEKQNTERSS